MTENSLTLFFFLTIFFLNKKKASINSNESGSQESICTSQKITEDIRAKAQRISEVDETNEDHPSPEKTLKRSDEDNKENLEASDPEDEARDKPTVLRSQSHYSIPVSNG